MLVKTIQYTAKQNMILENIITDAVKRTGRNFNLQQFEIFMNSNIEYLQVLVVQRRFWQYTEVTYRGYILDRLLSGESMALNVVSEIKVSYPKKIFVTSVKAIAM